MEKIAIVALLMFIGVTVTLDVFANDGAFLSAIYDGLEQMGTNIAALFTGVGS